MTYRTDSDSERQVWERSPEPGWIESPGGPLFCWYHPPRGVARSRAVLLCEPLGHDRMNLHLSYRHLALTLSHAGYPTLRFDYAGTGDSSGSPRDPDWAENWSTGLDAAAETLLARSGAAHLALFGARVGGTLATRFAALRPEVDSLILWGPYVDGRAFLRHERAFHRIIDANQTIRRPSYAKSSEQEFVGFVYDTSARNELESIGLLNIRQPSLRQARIFAWDVDSPDDQLAAHLSERGVRVDFSRSTDFSSEASLTEQTVPEWLLDEAVEWLDRLEEPGARETPARAIEGSLPTRTQVQRIASLPRSVDEEALYFGDDGGLFGILSRPTADSGAGGTKPALILVSGGNNARAGINRNYTEWARDAASRGFTTLRFDIRGLGDSPPIHARDLNQLYLHETRHDLRAAVDLVEKRVEPNGIILCGLCAGAFQSLHAALEDDRVTGVVFFDLLRWDLDSKQVRRPGFLDRRRRNIQRFSRRLRSLFTASNAAPEPSPLADQLTRLVDRSVDLVAVGCLTRGGHEHFVEAIGPARAELEASGHFRLEGLDSTDHIFSPRWAQEWLGNLLLETLDRAAERSIKADCE